MFISVFSGILLCLVGFLKDYMFIFYLIIVFHASLVSKFRSHGFEGTMHIVYACFILNITLLFFNERKFSWNIAFILFAEKKEFFEI